MRLLADSSKCSGCGACLVICPLTHFQNNNPTMAALTVEGRFPAPGGYQVGVCTQCGECANVCPSGAIALDEASGVYWVDPELCTLCMACVDICPESVMFVVPDVPFAIKCDACGECVKYCGPGVLSISPPLPPPTTPPLVGEGKGERLTTPPPHVYPLPKKPTTFPLGGYAGTILRVNLTTKAVSKEPLPLKLVEEYLGGRGFAARLLYDEVPAGADPLGPQNKVVFASGPLAGLFVPGAGKATFAAKSPLTGSYGDANVGGHLAEELKYAGYDAVIIEGQSPTPVYLLIDDDKVEVRAAGDLWGQGAIATEKALKDRLGEAFQIATIGPAGEKLVKFACVGHDFGRQAGRTGVGAVLGAKKLKAIAVRGSKSIPIGDVDRLVTIGKAMFQSCFASPGRQVWQRYGTAGVTTWSNEMGSFPTRNFQSGQLAGYESLSGEVMREAMVLFDKGCGLCPVPCGKYSYTRGLYVEGPEYETTAMLGGMCALTDIHDVAQANYLCDELGLDTISAGSVIAFATECFEKGIIGLDDTGGLALQFGQAAPVFALIEKIARREGIGDVLAEGVKIAAERWGRGSADFAMQVKGMEISGYECHRAPAMLLSYMTTDIGAHHNRAWAITYDLQVGREKVTPDKAAKVIQLQHIRPLFDSLGACRLHWVELSLGLEHYPPALSAIWGREVTWEELLKCSERTWNLTRLWWVREFPDFGRAYDYPPARFYRHKVTGGPTDGAVMSWDDVQKLLDMYYQQRGWDQNGIPTAEKLRELGLNGK